MANAALPRDRRRVLSGRRRQRRRGSAAQVKFASVQTLEKIPRAIELTAQRHVRPRLGAAQRQRHRPSVGGRRRVGRVAAADPRSTRRPARTSSVWPASRRPKTRRAIAPSSSRTRRSPAAADDYFARARAAARVDAAHARSRRTSFTAAIASTSFRPRRRRRSTCALLPDEDPRVPRAVKQVVDDPAVDVRFGAARHAAGADAASTPRRSRRSRPRHAALQHRRRCRR